MAVTFAIALVPVLLGAGVAVDMIRVNNAQSALQAAADAAALAGGASGKATDEEIKAVAAQYLTANGASAAVETLDVQDISNDPATGKFRVSLQGKVRTTFMSLAGIQSYGIGAESEVMRGTGGPLEFVLALDTTYSMIENDKIGTLKTAASNLVNAVMKGDHVKGAVVPFADYFKVGKKYKNEPWITVPPPETSTYESCSSVTYPNKSGCTVQTTCFYDGIPYSCNYETCTDWGTPVKTGCTTVTDVNDWDGCIAARPPAYHASIADPSVPYPGVLWDCGAPLVTLTNSKAQVLDGIDALWPNGQTFIPSGLIWAWNVLTPEVPLTEATPMSEVISKGGKKALVLMTDGTNTVAPYTDGNYGDPADAGYGAGSSYADGLTTSLCTKIKDEGTIIYTVLFDVSDANIENLLRDCASDSGKSFVAADAAELLAAFKNIGTSLTQLRLTK